MRGRRRWPLRATSSIVLLIALAATAAASWGVYAVVHDQEHRLLKERGLELNLLLTSSIQAVESVITVQGGILQATHGSTSAYEQVASTAAAADVSKPSFAWLRPTAGGTAYVVVAAAGDALHRGDLINDSVRKSALDLATHDANFVATDVFDTDRKLGFAVGAPTAPPGTVLYRQISLGPVQAPRSAGAAPFDELNVAIYGASTPSTDKVLSTTTTKLPLHGEVRTDPLVVGNIHWLVAISPRRPLVGSVTADSWWLTLLIGVLGSLLLAAVVETSRRRRDAALALYASEHHVAETLQRSLLPQLPELPGLDIAARYLAGSKGQEVGGDWFDVFPVAGGAVAITVGDVIGHDIAAASAMAQIRSVVRAYAVEGDEPKSVINRLDRLVQALGLTQLATVVFGLLSAPAADGSRAFTFTNAGHPAPLLRLTDGQVEPLLGADPVLIGAPMTVDHMQTVRRLEHGSTLLLFTDGLVEDPARSLDETTADVAACLAEHGAGTDVEALCDRLLDTAAARELRDDVAVLVIRIDGPA